MHDSVNTIIETDQLGKRYGAITAVDAVSLRVARGEIYGFLGLNSAGKTTTIRALLFTLVTTWVFGREFSDHTTKELLALPTPRAAIVGAKFVVVGFWAAGLTALVFALGLLVGAAIGLPGWSRALVWRAAGNLIVTAGLTIALMSPVALLASAGRGYLPPLGWAFLTLFLAQILAAISHATTRDFAAHNRESPPDKRVFGNSPSYATQPLPGEPLVVAAALFDCLRLALCPSFFAVSPTRIVPGCTTFALMPRKCSCLPTGELTNFMASRPNRATNFWHPLCGRAVTSITAEPSANRVPGGRLSALKSMSMNS